MTVLEMPPHVKGRIISKLRSEGTDCMSGKTADVTILEIIFLVIDIFRFCEGSGKIGADRIIYVFDETSTVGTSWESLCKTAIYTPSIESPTL